MNEVITRLLYKLETHIHAGTYEPLESDKIEIKSLAHSSADWTELYKTVCAFLNSEGGMVIIGIKEKTEDKKYLFTTFRGEQSEENKIKELSNLFSDEKGVKLDLKEQFPGTEIIDFLDGRVCVVYVEKLPEDKKYVFLNGTAWYRNLTGDHKISTKQIEEQNEYKQDLGLSRELTIVKETGIENLDFNKLNRYIDLLNRGFQVESLKPDINSAIPFLTRKSMIRGEKPTLLGMLVCGSNIYDHVGGRCQVDAYVDSEIVVASNKQVIKDNIVSLMENVVGFVYRNIQVGVSHEKGGSQIPEYPQRLIRETVNNALAHRDYASDDFVTLEIRPNRNLEISNPGRFRPQQLLQFKVPGTESSIIRIVPIAKAQNPKLADILKTYDRWEGRGTGMASLTNACLDNQIDVPYYILHPSKISLIIPKGRVLDDNAQLWLDSFDGYIRLKNNSRGLTEEERIVLTYFYKSERLNREHKYTVLLTQDNNHSEVIAKLEEQKLIYKIEKEGLVYPIYLIDRELLKTDFFGELRTNLGTAFNGLGDVYKDVLNVIWLFNHYGNSDKQVNALTISNCLFYRKNRFVEDVEAYNAYQRKIRNVINRLEDFKFIARKGGVKPDFLINMEFKNSQLFKSWTGNP